MNIPTPTSPGGLEDAARAAVERAYRAQRRRGHSPMYAAVRTLRHFELLRAEIGAHHLPPGLQDARIDRAKAITIAVADHGWRGTNPTASAKRTAVFWRSGKLTGPIPAAPRPQRPTDGELPGSLIDLQGEVAWWVGHNFGNDNELATVAGLAEEVGEVMRAAVKRSQGIRGTRAEWDAELRKECGDVLIKLCDVAQFYGFDLWAAVRLRWGIVRRRDWKANPQGHGIDGAA